MRPDPFHPLARDKPDIPRMRKTKDFNGLILALTDPETDIQWQAAEALGELGKEDLTPLIRAIRKKNKDIRLGVIEAFGRIRDPSTVPVLTEALGDKSPEVRWEGALALGEIGETEAVPALFAALSDSDRYVRYGAAQALQALRWIPRGESEQAYLFLGKQEWDRLVALGEEAVEPLCLALRDRDAGVRTHAAESLGRIGSARAIPELYKALSDDDEAVRWQAVRAARNCGIPLTRLPRGLSKRKRRGQNPRVAAFLNFVLPGIGYMYIGKWWGILLFQIDVYATALLIAYTPPDISLEALLIETLFLIPIWSILAYHAWYLAKQIPEL
ncbi:MAG: HEAT repeat domain-containing protein [Methanoregulaceae archaeon]|nr:HEAT repeat domain-containing protein [Methanoregulaceae archaeon]